MYKEILMFNISMSMPEINAGIREISTGIRNQGDRCRNQRVEQIISQENPNKQQ